METSRSVSSVLVARSMPDQGGLKIIYRSNLQPQMRSGRNKAINICLKARKEGMVIFNPSIMRVKSKNQKGKSNESLGC